MDRNHQRAPCPGSPTVETAVLETARWVFESPSGHHFVRVAKQVKAGASKASHVRVRILPRTPFHAPLAQRQSGCFTCSGSGFRNSHGVPSLSRRLVAKARGR